ncbi:hypothetical protein Glove_182g18 [Diversispora epigaea]|uniref:Uncharacterized protein n=1 Tax=Diversispora epigaea TaxID=1348612 RepID=A0A397ISL5_9GLOM|nr:hypothetical protein Glove_182g18 [Diversispora epigaea]
MPLFRESNLEYDCCWCKPCDSKCFENDFDKRISGNEIIDKFDAQLNTDIRGKVIEFIHYDGFKDFKQIARGDGMVIHLRINVRSASVGLRGITKDPETHE